MATKGRAIVYIDSLGREHKALVTAINGMHEGFVSLAYVDAAAPERENVKRLTDVPHMSDPSVAESNPALPRYAVHAWKELSEEHRALPADHPAFDHPFAEPKRDEEGNRLPVARPEYEADVKQHRDSQEPDVATLL